MQVGDPKKTAFLAIVAVLALGFCFKQLTGGGGGPKMLRQAASGPDPAAGAPAQAQGTVAMLQLDDLHADPFSHPKLAPKIVDAAQVGAQPTTNPNPGLNPGGGTTTGGDDGNHAMPLPPPFGPGNGSGVGIVKDPPPDWAHSVNPGQKDAGAPQVKLTQITLKAIVKVGERLAYISIDGQDARGFHAGEVLKNDIQVAFVNDDSVIVKTGTKTVTLKVGQQGDL